MKGVPFTDKKEITLYNNFVRIIGLFILIYIILILLVYIQNIFIILLIIIMISYYTEKT